MIFTSSIFLLFYVLVFVAYWSLRGTRTRIWLLLVASQVFYGWWDPRFLLLMWVAIVVCHVAAIVIDESPRYRKPAIVIAIAVLLGILAWFKYFNFFLDSFVRLANAIDMPVSPRALQIALPVGISFFTFHAISYMVDVWRGKTPAERSLANTGLYISFFPQLVAGPIVRARDFLPQMQAAKHLTAENFLIGMKLFWIGFLYKAVFSDSVSPFVDAVYANVTGYDNPSLVFATIGFYAQIYFDFCGYSLMAIGIARTFDYRLIRNFDYPYISTNITEFWRRWHISLSNWLRDYLYIPLGGNRCGEWKRKRNLMLTMLLGGLWHGASWNFVLWGGLHGSALIVHKSFADRMRGVMRGALPVAMWTAAAWVITQLFVLLTWIPFRAQTFEDSILVLSAFVGLRMDHGLKAAAVPYAMLLLPVLLDIFAVGMPAVRLRLRERMPAVSPYAAAAVLGIATGLLLFMMPLEVTSFIYFQF